MNRYSLSSKMKTEGSQLDYSYLNKNVKLSQLMKILNQKPKILQKKIKIIKPFYDCWT